MRRLDTLIIKSFVGPFILTTVVATFVLLIQYMMKYFDDFVGKDLGAEVFAELLFYFSLNMLQVALPLGVLVSSLMTFGNLGENFELTAIKSAGISLVRALRPIFFFVIVLTFAAFEFNNYIVPAANLKAYSLLYDIKHKKPALDIKEGVFYNGIPDYSIKAQEKFPDNKTMKNVLIYDHTSGIGNNRVILADSSKMFMIYNDKYLKLELYNGNYYSEEPKAREPVDQFYRTNFARMDMVFNLSSFDLKRTKEELFQNNRQMKNIAELTEDMDSLAYSIYEAKHGFFANAKGFFSYHLDSLEINMEKVAKKSKAQQVMEESVRSPMEDDKADDESVVESPEAEPDSMKAAMLAYVERNHPKEMTEDSLPKPKVKRPMIKEGMGAKPVKTLEKPDGGLIAANTGIQRKQPRPDGSGSITQKEQVLLDTLGWDYLNAKVEGKSADVLQTARNQAQNVKINLSSVASRVDNLSRDYRKFVIEKYKKYSQAFACVVMFLIGAPLGSIIKKGGLGVPVIVSIIFFLIYYIIGIICEKSAKEGVMDPVLAVWVADLALLPVGLFFLRQARVDAKLFDTDFYLVWFDQLKQRLKKS
ncbi:LptF/LptG family permease [Marinoscillum sp. 108]|uniref:LptF/LptG family permease n=1 Tax=Marinoscillum sp. 108 TaxID=2653151 RepID=UPI0012F33092|nr:LptF/LptG family permease [Marinoscillum sp. 108]VXD21325.1 Lipopolysaccharide export system permease protein [Marinoscillum sp. 108]